MAGEAAGLDVRDRLALAQFERLAPYLPDDDCGVLRTEIVERRSGYASSYVRNTRNPDFGNLKGPRTVMNWLFMFSDMSVSPCDGEGRWYDLRDGLPLSWGVSPEEHRLGRV